MFLLSLPLQNRGISGDLLVFSHTFTTLGEMTDAEKANPQHFGSDPADIRIQIRINPEIHIQIPYHFRLRLDALAEVCAVRAHYSLMTVLMRDAHCGHILLVCGDAKICQNYYKITPNGPDGGGGVK